MESGFFKKFVRINGVIVLMGRELTEVMWMLQSSGPKIDIYEFVTIRQYGHAHEAIGRGCNLKKIFGDDFKNIVGKPIYDDYLKDENGVIVTIVDDDLVYKYILSKYCGNSSGVIEQLKSRVKKTWGNICH